jgi:hypothetical protein
MKLIRFISTPDNGSRFVEVDIPIDSASTDAFGHVIRRSAVLTAQSTMFTEMPEGLDQDWHQASRSRSDPAHAPALAGHNTGGHEPAMELLTRCYYRLPAPRPEPFKPPWIAMGCTAFGMPRLLVYRAGILAEAGPGPDG